MHVTDEARAARDEALDRVDRNAEPYWKGLALRTVRWLAARQSEFTTDDVWEAMEAHGIGVPREKRAMGAIMQRCARDRLVAATPRFQPSRRKEDHARPVRVWRSLTVGLAAAEAVVEPVRLVPRGEHRVPPPEMVRPDVVVDGRLGWACTLCGSSPQQVPTPLIDPRYGTSRCSTTGCRGGTFRIRA